MKANAPEKIYVHVKDDKMHITWDREWIGVHDIEYVRSDAFIKKAVIWISNNCYIPHSTLEDFKKYMKGE